MPDEKELIDHYVAEASPHGEFESAMARLAIDKAMIEALKIPYDKFVLEEDEKLLPLTEAIDTHNQRASEMFGQGIRALIIDSDDTLKRNTRHMDLPAHGAGFIFKILNTLFAYPDGLVSSSDLRRVSSLASMTVDQLNNRLSPLDPIITRVKEGTRVYFRLASDIVLIDGRAVKPGAAAPLKEEVPQPKYINPRRQKLNSNIKSRSLRKSPEAESMIPESASMAEPEAPETAENALPRIKNRKEVLNFPPPCFAVIENIGAINQRTSDMLEAIDGKMKANRLIILDDHHAEFDGEPYDIGPLPRYFLNKLISNYPFTWLPLTELSSDEYEWSVAKAEVLARRLAVGKKVFYQDGRVLLYPTIFKDYR